MAGGQVLQKEAFVRLQAKKKEENPSYPVHELRGRMWWANHGTVLSGAEQLFSNKQFPSCPHQPRREAPGVRSRGALRR